MSDSSAALAPKNTIAPRSSLEIRPRRQGFPRRDRAARVGAREIRPDVSGCIGVDRQIAVAHLQHAVDFSERCFAAGVRRLDDIGRRALRDAKRLHRETWAQAPIDIEDERHPPHDPVGVRPPVEEADAGGVLRQCGQRRERAGRRRQKLRRIVAGGDEARLRGICGAVRRVGDEAAQDDRRAVDSARKGVIRGLAGRRAGVGAVLFGEQEVECDRRSPGALQRLHERGEAVARPRPLPEAPQRLVVDIDDADGLVECVGARLPALVLVEDQVLNHRARRRARDAGNERERASRRRGQRVEFGLARFSHALLAVPQDINIEESPVLSSRWTSPDRRKFFQAPEKEKENPSLGEGKSKP